MIWSLQTLRFAAALMVVFAHAGETVLRQTGSKGLIGADVLLAGQAGVDLFFVLSGVIIATTARGMTFGEFAWKRFSRIVPFYDVVSIFAVVLAIRNGEELSWRDWLASLLFWPATDVMTQPILGVAWTLCFEMLFYAAAALVLVNRRLLILLLAIFLVALAFRGLAPLLQFIGNPLIFEFLFGVAIAQMPRVESAKWALPAGLLAFAAAAAAGMAPLGSTIDFLRGGDNVSRVVFFGIPAALVVLGAMQFAGNPGFTARQGEASYALYLTHPILMPVLIQVMATFHAPAEAIIAVAITACAAFAWRLHLAVEVPLLKWVRSLP